MDDPVDDILRDARRWRALMSSERIRIATEVHQPHSQPVPGSRYLHLELWSQSIYPNTQSHHVLIDYADYIIESGNLK